MPAIGGTFLSSHDPKRLVQWFGASLGIAMEPQGEGGMAIFGEGAGLTLLSVHAARPGAPAPAKGDVEAEPYGRQPMMVNLRVEDLDAILARLKANGDRFAGPVKYDGFGTFAWTRTPDGHEIELWQP